MSVATWLLSVAPTQPGELRLVEELGPRGRRRALIATAGAGVLLVGAVLWLVLRFRSKGQFAPELWRPFKLWGTWRYLLLGLVNTLKVASISLVLDNLRNPETLALPNGTRNVMRFSSNVMWINSRRWPAISSVAMRSTLPTPWVGYTT